MAGSYALRMKSRSVCCFFAAAFLLVAPLRSHASKDLPVQPRIVVSSLNIHREMDPERILHEVRNNQNLSRVDIFLLQEVEGEAEDCRRLVEELAGALGLPHRHAPERQRPGASGDGLVTLSRFPLRETAEIPLKRFDLVVNARRRIALDQSAAIPMGRLRLINLHLDTRINTRSRLEQLNPVIEAIQEEVGPVVIGGDFNTVPFRWLWHLVPIPMRKPQAEAVIQRLVSLGFETPFIEAGPTHDHFGLRLDWLFLRGVRLFAQGIEEVDFSDHHAIWVEIGLP